MSKKQQIKKARGEKKEDTAPVEPKKIESAEKSLSDADELMDKIDEILDEQGEAFYRSFVQTGGE